MRYNVRYVFNYNIPVVPICVFFVIYIHIYIHIRLHTYTSYTQVPDESGFVPYHRIPCIPCFDVLVFLNQVKQGMLNFFLFDYHKFGHQKKKIVPHRAGHSLENSHSCDLTDLSGKQEEII